MALPLGSGPLTIKLYYIQGCRIVAGLAVHVSALASGRFQLVSARPVALRWNRATHCPFSRCPLLLFSHLRPPFLSLFWTVRCATYPNTLHPSLQSLAMCGMRTSHRLWRKGRAPCVNRCARWPPAVVQVAAASAPAAAQAARDGHCAAAGSAPHLSRYARACRGGAAQDSLRAHVSTSWPMEAAACAVMG